MTATASADLAEGAFSCLLGSVTWHTKAAPQVALLHVLPAAMTQLQELTRVRLCFPARLGIPN